MAGRGNRQGRHGVLDFGEESVSVGIEEVPAREWKQKVYEPEIVKRDRLLYKKPGYEM